MWTLGTLVDLQSLIVLLPWIISTPNITTNTGSPLDQCSVSGQVRQLLAVPVWPWSQYTAGCVVKIRAFQERPLMSSAFRIGERIHWGSLINPRLIDCKLPFEVRYPIWRIYPLFYTYKKCWLRTQEMGRGLILWKLAYGVSVHAGFNKSATYALSHGV